MTRKPKDPAATPKPRGGYRHGVPGGGGQDRIAIDCTIDLKQRWLAAAVRAGFPPRRSLAPFIIAAVEAYIKAEKLEP
jgi:hypothetical protein